MTGGTSLRVACSGIVSTMAIFGCAVRESITYPSDWAQMIASPRCEQLSGRYTNQATAATDENDPGTRFPSKGFLASLLRHGTLDNYDMTQLKTTVVLINSVSTEFTVYAGATPQSSTPLGANWGCDPSGKWVGVFSKRGGSEGSVGNVTKLRVELIPAVDGSLIAHFVAESEAYFPPGVYRSETWALFERLP